MTKTSFIRRSRLGLLVCLTVLLCLIAPNGRAQQDQSQQDQPDQQAPAQDQQQYNDTQANDPPTRVARISHVDGEVSFQPGGVGDWGAANKNRPVTIGDKIWSDKDSRVELQAGQAAIHVGDMTALSFLNLDQAIIQLRLPEGKVNFRVRELREGDLYEVDTPILAFIVKQAGAFRVDVSEDGTATRVIAIRGEGEVSAGGKTYQIRPGERAEFNGGDDGSVQYSVDQAPDPDAFDRWAADRDLKEENSVSAQYISRDTVGYSDLDENGSWEDNQDYGHVWYPNEPDPNWAPYSTGNWSYVAPWGWTWVDVAPWGFAPFHYGRWAFVGSRWGWCPGPVYGYPIYGPAFVGFLGGGVGFGFGIGVGWFPLGFGEPFHPWFRTSREFVTRINVHNTFIRNTTVINNRNFNFANAHNVRAVTATSRAGFVGGQSINRGATHIDAATLRSARVTNGAGFTPTRQSFTGSAAAGGHIATPPASVQNRAVLARTAPSASARNLTVRSVNPSTGFQNRGVTSNRVSGGSRSWSAQGNVTDRGNAPQGAGRGTSNGAISNGQSQGSRSTQSNRSPSAGNGQSNGNTANGGSRTGSSQRPPNVAPRQTYTPPARSSTPSSATRGGSSSVPRSAPPATHTAPPSHSSGGGGSSHPSGGGSSHPSGGSGSSHPSGGGGSSHGGGSHGRR